MNGLLVRVGIDSTDGCWNAPMRLSSGEFAYITITDTKPLRVGMARRYDEFIPVVKRFGKQLPPELNGAPTHLDPDFDQLTYGDQGQRGKRITSMVTSGDVLAFFAALRPVDGPARPLIYALIGLYVVEEIVQAKSVPKSRWAENAHTRRVPGDGDIVVRAKTGVSGRLRRCIPIGELRGGVYRVRNDLLDAWGGLDIKDGYIHRSVRLPAFHNAAKFYGWFLAQKPELLAENNPAWSARLFIVMLRRPRKNDPRTDPFWEFGSFGCTGCHRKNLLHPKNCQIRDGDRLAFVQGGQRGARLLLVTPPVQRFDHPGRVELRWDSGQKPFRYDCAPSLFESPAPGRVGLFPRLTDSLAHTNRSTINAKLASRFRARTNPLEPELARELETGFNAAVKRAGKSDFITRYEEALPWCDCPSSASDRKRHYQQRLRELKNAAGIAPRKKGCCK